MNNLPIGVYIKNDNYNYVAPDISLIYDEEKLDRKGCYGVREYWIVDPKHKQMTIYFWEESGQPALYLFPNQIKVRICDDLYLDLINRHDIVDKMLVEERQEVMQQGMRQSLPFRDEW